MKKEDNKIDITAWCDNSISAANHLEDILNSEENKQYAKHISKDFIFFNSKIKSLKDIKNNQHRMFFMQQLYMLVKQKIKSKKYPVKIETHLLNVITASYRQKKNTI